MGQYQVFCHWGKTGAAEEEMGGYRVRANYQCYPVTSKAEAIIKFKEWFRKKTNNNWDERHNFKQTPNYYNFMEQSTRNAQKPPAAGVGGAAAESKSESGSGAVSKLDPKVAALVELMFDEDMILNSMAEVGVKVDDEFDLVRNPVETPSPSNQHSFGEPREGILMGGGRGGSTISRLANGSVYNPPGVPHPSPPLLGSR